MRHDCFELEALDPGSQARAGWLTDRNGKRLPTPLFQPVATSASLKTLDWADLEKIGYRHVLMNTYHLVVDPGTEPIRAAGGVKQWSGWRGSVLTDSGGYQAFSLAARRSLKPGGVEFTDHLHGGRHLFSPEFTLTAQLNLGVDFVMPIDVCTGLPAERKRVIKDMRFTHDWLAQQVRLWPELAGRLALPADNQPVLFGIAQGGLEEDLREQSIQLVSESGVDSIAIGGLAVGEPREDFLRLTEFCGQRLPADKVHYLMGVGEPADLVFAVAMGFDMFDCVQPTRMARHGSAYTRHGRLQIKNSRFRDDNRPLDPQCRCQVCRRYSRSYINHLQRTGEHTAARLLTWHNLAFYRDLMKRLRRLIVNGTFGKRWQRLYRDLNGRLPEDL
ncbi:tRNA guanosine(34) transglycosylase Tgt [bacterium]|nr:tRNA guanosine(34) transglycosylase Tgt [bacterium]UNM09373.1 MAG: tRNA guanosine(34) transglycosylase Tgt [Planctomycetales bacterium]